MTRRNILKLCLGLPAFLAIAACNDKQNTAATPSNATMAQPEPATLPAPVTEAVATNASLFLDNGDILLLEDGFPLTITQRQPSANPAT